MYVLARINVRRKIRYFFFDKLLQNEKKKISQTITYPIPGNISNPVKKYSCELTQMEMNGGKMNIVDEYREIMRRIGRFL